MNMKYMIYEYATGMEKLFEQYPHLKDYFDRGTTPNEMIKIIKESLSQYNSKQNSKKEENDLKI